MKRRDTLRALAAIAACIIVASSAHAQSWPERPIKFIMAAPAGSSLDVLGRTIAEKLTARLGQPVVVEDKPAAGGTVATAEVAKAAPVITTTSQPNVLAVNASLPVKSIADLVAYAKANPGKLNYASVGNGSSSHLNMELFKQMAGIDAVHVPFNGSPPAVTATIQGETQMMFAVMQPLQAQIQAGKLRALAVTTAKRFPLLPEYPTIAESGYPGFEALAWNGVLVPAATPKAIVTRLNSEIDAILKEPDVVQKLHAQGFDLIGGTPEAFGALIKGETEKWAPVIKKLGLKVD